MIDPVDGSTNAHRGVPFYATSICVLDGEGPRVGVVVNQATGVRYAAARGGGADKDGQPIEPSGCEDLRSAIVGISGFPGLHPGWAQYRALGAASLECCAVAEGCSTRTWWPGGALCTDGTTWPACSSAARLAQRSAERDGRDLVVRDATSRRPIVAATPALAARLEGEQGL